MTGHPVSGEDGPPVPGGAEKPGDRIGPFRIVRELGEGGFGSVYEAEQDQPVRRRVALKVIKFGMDTREVIARFEAERQALALMDHPHIARVFDAGATGTGRPYFVMELVEGEPISSFCNSHHLSIEQRLELFEQVCAAIQHAHAKGVIHRDLKPGNVLVRMQDGVPSAKVIDFGIAKATRGRLTDRTLMTEADLMMGTPTYMSPEQAAGSADIDTRADVYSLGVILYELLTDTTPLDSDTLRAAGYYEVQRIIREVEPPRPSARLSKSPSTQAGIAALRRTDPDKLTSVVRGELDWIVMKAIEKDRARRYESANSLAMDVRRYLSNEPVLAAPPGKLYRLRKFVRRHQGTVAAGSLVAACLVAGIAAFGWQAHAAKARAEELEQVTKFQEAMLRQVDTTQAGRMLSDDVQAKFAAALDKAGVPAAERAQRIAAFAQRWQRVNATDAATRLIDRTILQPAVAAIDQRFKDQPAVDASLRQALANRYVEMGLYDPAMPLQRRALDNRRRWLGNDDVETVGSIVAMGNLLDAQGKLDEAEPYFREALATSRRVFGEDNSDTIEAASYLGSLLREQGKLAEAEPYMRRVLETRRRKLGEDHPDTLVALSDMAGLLVDRGRLSEAEPLMREIVAKFRSQHGEGDIDTLRSINNLGTVLAREGKPKEAEPYMREALEKRRRLLGEEHPDTLQSLVSLGGMLLDQGRLREAEPLLREAVEKSRRVLGANNADTLIAISLMGRLLLDQGKGAEAEALLAPSETAARRELADIAPPRFAFFLASLGKARAASQEFAAARDELVEAQAIYFKSLGAGDRHTRVATQALVELYTAWNKAEPGMGFDRDAAAWGKKLDAMGGGEKRAGK